MIDKAELIIGRPVILPSKEPVLQAGLSRDDSEEMDEEISVHSSEGYKNAGESLLLGLLQPNVKPFLHPPRVSLILLVQNAGLLPKR